jgi:hypothetical protein
MADARGANADAASRPLHPSQACSALRCARGQSCHRIFDRDCGHPDAVISVTRLRILWYIYVK